MFFTLQCTGARSRSRDAPCVLTVEYLKIRVFRCVARLSQCLSVPLSVLKKDILIYLCNWIWAGWSSNLNVISFRLSLSFPHSLLLLTVSREREVGVDVWRLNYLPRMKCPHYWLDKTLHIPCLVLQVSGFKPDFISNTWAGLGLQTGPRSVYRMRGWKEQHRATNLSDLPPGIHTLSCSAAADLISPFMFNSWRL